MIKNHPKLPQISKSDYYYILSKEDKDIKNDEIMNRIIDIYYCHKGRYGYRRVYLQLLKEGYYINHKKVQRLMNKMGLKGIKRNKRRYSSYQGTIGKIANNIIQRDFFSDKPNKKWYTDVTEFNLKGDKIYLSPILDGYAGDIVSYNISKIPSFNQITDMMNKARIARELSTSNYVGEVGEKIDIDVVEFACVHSYETIYGLHRIYKFRDDKDNVYVWKTSVFVPDPKLVVRVTGTVKDHKEYNGVKETEMTRCKFSKEIKTYKKQEVKTDDAISRALDEVLAV